MNAITPKHCDLPITLSETIRLALRDLTACEADPRYKIDMGVWHWPKPREVVGKLTSKPTCYICLAGAVLAQTCGVPMHDWVTPNDFDTETERKLFALDLVRNGSIWGAIECFHGFDGFSNDKIPRAVTIPDYSNDPSGFHVALGIVAEWLEPLRY